jgi:hypothetical protein
MTTNDETNDKRPFWLPEPCPPWCAVEHTDIDGDEDRAHESQNGTVTLSMEKARYVEIRETRDAYGVPLKFEVCARQGYREVSPHLLVWDTSTAGKPRIRRMTLDEGEAFAHAVLDAVKAARS